MRRALCVLSLTGLLSQAQDTRAVYAAAQAAQAPPVAAGGVVLAEVRFDPLPGAVPFVELLNTGTAAADLSTLMLRVGEAGVLLARVAEPLAPGARFVVLFDGMQRTDRGTLHAPTSITFTADAGSVEIVDEFNAVIDRVAWGAMPGAVALARGGIGLPSIPEGSSIGRSPGANRPGLVTEWTVYSPAAVTPGADNPMPVVSQLVPVSGALLETPSVALSWYAMPGAARYRVQIATDTAFQTMVVNQVVETSAIEPAALAAGGYWWRVQAMPSSGGAAAFSEASQFSIRAPSRAARASSRAASRSPGRGASWVASWLGLLRSPSAPQQRQNTSSQIPAPQKLLPVPIRSQHKDTRMLQLENPNERGVHAWNVDHGVFSASDLSDKGNCLLASIAMINRYYRGDMTQDRLAWEALGPRAASHLGSLRAAGHSLTANMLDEPQVGPEWDMVFGSGLILPRALAALEYALGAAPKKEQIFNDLDRMWRDVTAELDANRPVIGYTGHAIVITGYGIDTNRHRLLWVNDPQHGQYIADIDVATAFAFYSWIFLPVNATGTRQEPTVRLDSDGDGVIDFDEVERFRTSPQDRDSDADGVPDFEDILSGVFEREHPYGYAFAPSPSSKGRDFDGDGLPTERDPDSDNGGCRDGVEDEDRDGRRNGRETGNFDTADDVCQELNGSVSWTTIARHTVGGQTVFNNESGVVTVKLKPEGDGEHFVDAGSQYTFNSSAQVTIAAGPGCTMIARVVRGGTGGFVEPDGEIGGGLSSHVLAIGARGPGTEQSTADLCYTSGTSRGESSFTMPECPGLPVPGSPRTFKFDCNAPIEPTQYIGGPTIILWRVSGTVSLP